ncbi:hypothetical protein NQ318_002040 [Aromia moschata]|uniref:Uncharacterized protein n=1 Tax=Aromia moschata TaxID=1265417 RepID=A0AAV8Z4F9_9CUCU|nr:hypothetical protein NQ318_002040 [Aromia moschata]
MRSKKVINLWKLLMKEEVYDKMQTAIEVPAGGITFEDAEYQKKIKLPNLTAKEEVYDKMQTAIKVPADGITFEDAEYQEKD